MRQVIAMIALVCSVSTFAAVMPSETDHVVSLDGTWRFKIEQAKGKYEQRGETGKIAIDYPEKIEPFYTPDYKEAEGWSDIKVPANWEMAGLSPATYNQPDNASGFYRLSFEVPKAWVG